LALRAHHEFFNEDELHQLKKLSHIMVPNSLNIDFLEYCKA